MDESLTADATMPSSSARAADEAGLWAAWRERRDADAREALLERHLPYAKTVAATYYGRRQHDEIEFAEYLQYARIGMLEALDRYDPAMGAQFRTFAARRMHGAILDGIEKCTEKQQQIAARQRVRHERAAEIKASAAEAPSSRRARDGDELFRYLAEVGIGLALCRLLEGTAMIDAGEEARSATPDRHYQAIELSQLRRRIDDAVARLQAQQRTVIRYHYVQEHSFEDIATLMAVTRSRISQIHRQALTALRAELRSTPACDVAW